MLPVNLEIKGMQQLAVDNIKLLLESIDEDTPIHLVFTAGIGYQSFTAGIELFNLIAPRENTSAEAHALLGPQVLPFVACQKRALHSDAEISLTPPAYLAPYAKDQLIKYIEGYGNQLDGGYFSADEYENISNTLYQTSARMRILAAQQIVILGENTEIPEKVLAEELHYGIELEPLQALKWGIATEILDA